MRLCVCVCVCVCVRERERERERESVGLRKRFYSKMKRSCQNIDSDWKRREKMKLLYACMAGVEKMKINNFCDGILTSLETWRLHIRLFEEFTGLTYWSLTFTAFDSLHVAAKKISNSDYDLQVLWLWRIEFSIQFLTSDFD